MKLALSIRQLLKRDGVKAMMTRSEDSRTALLIAEDPRSKALLETAAKAAMSNAAILITGETGVGKELIARYIHDHSALSAGPYVTVNCAALPENMIESILFGYEKGAFTGAYATYIGKFEQAHGGTLLLDEVAEIPLGLQAKLLRVLQEKEIERLGGRRMIKVETRIIAATNRDLKQEVLSGHFRSDLYYRLNVVPIHCDALRARRLDILPLAYYFIEKHANVLGKTNLILNDEAKNKLLAYDWPGNIRELENVLHRAVIMLNDNVIDENDVILNEIVSDSESETTFASKIKESEANVILNVLHETDGSREAAAKILNISPRTLRYKLAKLKEKGIKLPRRP